MEGHTDLLVILDNSYPMEFYLNRLSLTRQVFDQPPTVTIPPVTVWMDLVGTSSSDHEVSERFELSDNAHNELLAIFCIAAVLDSCILLICFLSLTQ